MSDASDIKALTLNTKTVFRTSAACDRVKINNNSSMYLRVYFGADAPASATDPAGWHTTIDPGDKPLVGIVGAQGNPFADRSYIQSTPYQGVLTVLPFFPAGAALSAGGIVSGGSFCHLTAYYPGEFAESGSGDEAFVLAVKQARHQTVTGAIERYIAAFANTSPATVTMNTASGANPIILTPARCPGLFAWASKVAGSAADVVNVHVHFYGLNASWSPGAAAAAAINWHIEAAITNAANTLDKAVEALGSYKNGVAYAAPSPTTEHIEDKLPHPACVTLAVFGPGVGGPGLVSGDVFRVRLIRESAVGTFDMRINADVLFDGQNQSVHNDRPYVPVIYTTPNEAPYDAAGNQQTW